jgi:hypothetical protein
MLGNLGATHTSAGDPRGAEASLQRRAEIFALG